MSQTMKTPGVYIQELDAFGNSVVPVATAVPAFIGYTAQTTYNGKSVLNKAVKITSLTEFMAVYGDTPPEVQYSVASSYTVKKVNDIITTNTEATAAKAAADKAVSDAGSNATQAQKDAQTAADAAATAAAAALTEANKNTDVAGLITAIGKLAKNTDPTKAEALQAAVKTAEEPITKVAQAANYIANDMAFTMAPTTINYRMYSAMKFFYENGGGDCYVISVGEYDYSKKTINDITAFQGAIELLKKEHEPTMLLIPDIVEIADPTADPTKDDYLQTKYANAYSLMGEMINHCGEEMNRVAILDVPGGWVPPSPGSTSSVDQFRDSVEPTEQKSNSYAATYYPWLHTTVYQASEISYKNIEKASYGVVSTMLTDEFTTKTGIDKKVAKIITAFSTDPTKAETPLDKADLILQNLSKSYQMLMGAIKTQMNLIAPSSAMAGIYTSVDNSEGVWVAPANVGVQSVIKPAITISHEEQEDLNIPLDGKAICAIRAFTGRGNLVWGARTLDGNSNDWRYINVRRTLIYIEQSVKEAAKAYVFAPNVSSTWVNVESLIGNFLTGLWKQGGLVGPKAADSFQVSVGLGSTMTNDDIQNGIMRVSVKVAVSHPAEFIEITFQQEAQKG